METLGWILFAATISFVAGLFLGLGIGALYDALDCGMSDR